MIIINLKLVIAIMHAILIVTILLFPTFKSSHLRKTTTDIHKRFSR